MARRIPRLAPHEEWNSPNVDTWRRELTSDAEKWFARQPSGDWVPDGANQWIGNNDKHPKGIVVGNPSGDPSDPGLEGALVARGKGGGVVLIGTNTTGFKSQRFTKQIGNAGSLYGYRPQSHPASQFGTLNPPTFEGLDVWQFTANPGTNICVLQFDDGTQTGTAQLESYTSINVVYVGHSEPVVVTWSGSRYEVTDAALAAYVTANNGASVFVDVTAIEQTPENRPVDIAGSPVLLSGFGVYLEVPRVLDKEYYLIAGKSVEVSGRNYAPILVGPEYIPSLSQSKQDTRDIQLDGFGTLVDVVTLDVTTGPYQPGATTFRYDVTLHEAGSQIVNFNVEIWGNIAGSGLVFIARDEYALVSQVQNISRSYPTTQTITVGDQLVLRISSENTHPLSDGWVRGQTRPSLLELRQG